MKVGGRENRPVIYVSWDEAVAYCKWLSQETGLTFQLPTEAQWEKAARGTKGLIYLWGTETRPVDTYLLVDMAGKVWEWCADWYDENYYKESPGKNPRGPLKGEYRSLRGDLWNDPSGLLRCVARAGVDLWGHWNGVGFRVVCEEKRL